MGRHKLIYSILVLFSFSQIAFAQNSSTAKSSAGSSEQEIALAAEMAAAELSEGVTVTPSRGPASAGSCRVSCSGFASVKVDVKAKCMCIGSKCITVDIGSGGPKQTTNGTGTMGNAAGILYKTYPGPGLSTLNRGKTRDNDAISMGIPLNDAAGKWIHKSRGCGSAGGTVGGRQNTSGCIAIPCAHWPLVKSQRGKSITVCNANNDRWPPPKGEKKKAKPRGSNRHQQGNR